MPLPKIQILSSCLFLSAAICAQVRTEAEVIDLAFQYYPSVQIADQQVLRQKALERTAFNPPQPQATIETPGDVGIGFEIVQEFAFPGVYHTKSRLLKSETRLAEQGAHISRLELKRSVRLAFLEAQTSHAKSMVLSKQDSLWNQLARSSQRLFDSGEINKAELLYAQTTAGRVAYAAEQSRTDVQHAFSTLAMYTGEPVPSVAPLAKLPDVMIDTDQPFYFESYLASQEEVAASEIAARKSERLPGFLIGYVRAPDLDTEFRSRVKAGITIPIWQRQYSGEIAAAKISMDQRHATSALQQIQAEAARAEISQTMTQTRQALEWLEQSALPQTEDFIETSMRLFDAGETDYILTLRNISDVLELQQLYVENLQRHNEAIIELEYLTGQ